MSVSKVLLLCDREDNTADSAGVTILCCSELVERAALSTEASLANPMPQKHLASSLGSRQGGAGVGLGVAGNGESKGCGTLLTAHPCLHRGLSQAPPLAALSI